jgi:hypothetical protein
VVLPINRKVHTPMAGPGRPWQATRPCLFQLIDRSQSRALRPTLPQPRGRSPCVALVQQTGNGASG